MRSTSRVMTKAIRVFNTDPILISLLMGLGAVPVAFSMPWWARIGFVIISVFAFWIIRKQFKNDPRKPKIFMRAGKLKSIYDPGKRRIFRIRAER